MGSIRIALGRRHLTQDTYPRIIYRRKESFAYEILLMNTSYILRTKRNIYPINMVKKRSHQAVSKGCELEPEHSERFIIQATLELLDKEVPIRLLVDSGASGPILHEDFVRKNGLLVKKENSPNRSRMPMKNQSPMLEHTTCTQQY